MKKILCIAAIVALSLSVASCSKDLNDYKEDMKELIEKENQAHKDGDIEEEKALNKEIGELCKSAEKELSAEDFEELSNYYFSMYK